MVSKEYVKWRMCADYTNLSYIYLKDCYPLPQIDQMVGAINGHAYLSFMDANSGYDQVMMGEKDNHKTTFTTSRGVYNYKVMVFSLKTSELHFKDWWMGFSKNRDEEN